jgi:cytochrome c oxidase cbb3-type subunit III
MIARLLGAFRGTLRDFSLPLVVCLLVAGCKSVPRTWKSDPEVPSPEAVLDFAPLFQQNCAGCHGTKGIDGPAYPLGNPEYQALVDESTLRQIVTQGLPGTLMPAFAISQGGTLTDQQIAALVAGMRAAWWRPRAVAGANPPPYHPDLTGDPARGHLTYTAYCAACHGEAGHPQDGFAGSVADANFLALMSDQVLRTVVVAGRPDVGMPDWKGDFPGDESGHPKMNDQQVTDVVAWLSSQRLNANAGLVPGSQNQSALNLPRTKLPKTPETGGGGLE